jgi:mannosyltransferase
MTTRFRSLTTWLSAVRSRSWLLGVLLLALALRCYRLDANSLWFDEAFSWLAATRPLGDILTQRLEPFLPALYHLLLHGWLWLGQSEAALRSLSVLFGVATVAVMYAAGRCLFDSRTGLAAALLTAALPFQIYYSQEARPYALVVLCSALLLWAFVRAWQRPRWTAWLLVGLAAGISFYTHYFVVFGLIALHSLVLLRRAEVSARWRGLLVADAVALVLVTPHLAAAVAHTRQVTGDFWLASPSPLQPIKTLHYLLFGHTTPQVVVPVALFLLVAVLVMLGMAVARAARDERAWLLLLTAWVAVPILGVLVISWLVGPLYLDRSFSLATPAYLLLLAWGLVNPLPRSPTPLLYAGLGIVVAVSLVSYYSNPDPAKPPFREAGATIEDGWQAQDVLLSLHDSSYLPLRYYAPGATGYLLNNDPAAWLPPETWAWAGPRITSVDEVVGGRSRLWLVTMPGRLTERQRQVAKAVESRFALLEVWHWPAFDAVDLRLYDLRAAP